MESRKYHFNNSTLNIIFGDITTSKAEVIVSSDDTDISMGGGISGCLRRLGGEIIREDAQKKLPAQIGDVVVSTAGKLEHQKYVFHCLSIDYKHKSDLLNNQDELHNYILKHSIDKCFRLLQVLDINSIAFPCIGAGVAQIPLKKVAEIMADAISANLCRTQKPYEIELYLYDRYGILSDMDYIDMFENFAIKSAMSRYMTQLSEDKYASDSCPGSKIAEIPKREGMNHRVFISYSRKDSESVSKILEILEEYKISYWIDKEGIFSGENYKEVIVDAIDTAKVVIFVSSANANTSVNVIRELGYAVKQQKTIIPVLLDDHPYAKSIRLDIADIDQIEYSDDDISKKKLVTSLAYAIGRK